MVGLNGGRAGRISSAAGLRSLAHETTMTRVEAEGIAVLWEDLLQRSPLPPRVAGVTGAEYELARLVQGGPVRVIEAPPAETWIWSDLHLRDRGAFEATGRPFPSLRAMEGRMLEAWTNNVSPGDTIVCLGDVAHPSAFEDDALVARLRNCPGRRLLILGNHDLGHRAALEEVGFRDQIAAALCATDPPVALTHMPLGRIPYGCVHLHGHLHAKGSPAPRRRDVGVDAIGFAPRRLDWLLEDLRAHPRGPRQGQGLGPEARTPEGLAGASLTA